MDYTEFLEEVRITRAENTYRNYCASLKKFPNATIDEIRTFIYNKSMKDTTKKQHLDILLLALRWYGKSNRDIERLIKGFRVNKPVQPCPTVDEIETVWKHLMTHRNRAMFALMAYNGLRIGEIVNANIDDLSMKKKQIVLCGTKGKRDTIVPLVHPRVINELKEYLQERKGKHTLSNALFLNGKGKRFSHNGLENLFKTEFVDNGYDYHCHSLRRFFANTLNKANVPVQKISAAMRHASVTTTMRYLNIENDDVRKTLDTVYACV